MLKFKIISLEELLAVQNKKYKIRWKLYLKVRVYVHVCIAAATAFSAAASPGFDTKSELIARAWQQHACECTPRTAAATPIPSGALDKRAHARRSTAEARLHFELR